MMGVGNGRPEMVAPHAARLAAKIGDAIIGGKRRADQRQTRLLPQLGIGVQRQDDTSAIFGRFKLGQQRLELLGQIFGRDRPDLGPG